MRDEHRHGGDPSYKPRHASNDRAPDMRWGARLNYSLTPRTNDLLALLDLARARMDYSGLPTSSRAMCNSHGPTKPSSPSNPRSEQQNKENQQHRSWPHKSLLCMV